MLYKPVTISASEFNEKFKNNLRDYYIYQYKWFRKDDSSDFRKKGTNAFKPASTFTEEKQRLLTILRSQDMIEWTIEKGGICCCTTDTRELTENPFWTLYRFCAAPPRYLGWLMSMVLFLHPGIRLRQGEDASTRDRDQALARPQPFGVSRELLQQHYLRTGGRLDVGRDQFRNRLDGECLGILRRKRISPRREQWRLSPARLEIPRSDEGLRFRLQQLLDFHSRTMPLGFIGRRILRRLGQGRTVLRFKHDFIAKALDDYNLMDLLFAIRRGLWLQIDFRNATRLTFESLVCLPLQIRESTQDGRQYLMYYHPGLRSVSALRLSFIDRIRFGTIHEPVFLAEDLARAKQLLPFIWGSSVPGYFQGSAAAPLPLRHVSLVVRQDDPLILRRLGREGRHGRITKIDADSQRITYQVDVADPVEMLPWVRSFLPGVLQFRVDGIPYDIRDPDLNRKLLSEDSGNTASPPPYPFRESADLRPPHEMLFHPFFSAAFDTMSEVLSDMLAQPDHFFTLPELTDRIARAWPTDIDLLQEQADAILENISMLCSGSARTGYRLDYLPAEPVDHFGDLLPLTDPELGYLHDMLTTPKARLFLTEQEIAKLVNSLPEPPAEAEIPHVFCCDQHRDPDPVCREIFLDILTALQNSRRIRAAYTGRQGSSEEILTPIHLEYSKREDRFRLICADGEGQVSGRDLERFTGVCVLPDRFDPAAAAALAQRHSGESRRKLQLSFRDEKNLPDRILTEFSPWKKRCIRSGSGYTMELYYDRADTPEIVIRLLRFGSGLRIESDTGDAAQLLRSRLEA